MYAERLNNGPGIACRDEGRKRKGKERKGKEAT
jgi:hypothetical protein